MDFDILRVSFLALIQGISEFLPISSSAHLILPSALFGWEDQGLVFDVAVHLGTLSAVIIYFYKDLYTISRALLKSIINKEHNDDSKLGWMILVATLPIAIVGFFLKDFVDQQLRSIYVIASSTLIFGFFLLLADIKAKATLELSQMSWKSCLFIAFSQVLALIPGTSRSGVTMTAALFCDLNRESAARFSFLLSIPTIAGAALIMAGDVINLPSINWLELIYAMFLSAVVAFLCIHFFLKAISAMGFMPFFIYRMVLGIGLFLIV